MSTGSAHASRAAKPSIHSRMHPYLGDEQLDGCSVCPCLYPYPSILAMHCAFFFLQESFLSCRLFNSSQMCVYVGVCFRLLDLIDWVDRIDCQNDCCKAASDLNLLFESMQTQNPNIVAFCLVLPALRRQSLSLRLFVYAAFLTKGSRQTTGKARKTQAMAATTFPGQFSNADGSG
mmetsp:Transcript_30565/g.60083  ORF Transcript_30565/g.60083 Transcript_30565/m.60083 type:complete len:176 (+) Transcript_30565:525-1052(+)